MSPISADAAGTLLNINAVAVASALSVTFGAEKLIVLGEAPGLLADAEGPAGLEAMRESGAIRTGMLPKALCTRKALGGGVARAHVLPAGRPDSPQLEVFTLEVLQHAGGPGPFGTGGGRTHAAQRNVGKGPPVFTPAPPRGAGRSAFRRSHGSAGTAWTPSGENWVVLP